MDKRQSLKSTFSHDGRSCQEIITDAQRLFEIREKKDEGERLVRDAEAMRKKGLELIKAADVAEKKEKIIQQAIREFIDSDAEFIEENGRDAMTVRLAEKEKNGRTFAVIKGINSEKQFMVFFKV